MMKILIPLFSLLTLQMHHKSNKTWHSLSMWLLLLTFISFPMLYSPMFSLSNISLWTSVDMMSAPLISLTLWISALMIYASSNVLMNKQAPFMFTFYIISLALILSWTFSVNNILLFYISFESSLIPTLLLIIGWGYQPERMQAGMYMMIYTIAASLPLLVSIIILYQNNAHLFMFSQMYSSIFSNSSFLVKLWWVMTITAFMVKMPLYFFHLWLPKAHVEAPVAGSMILAGILLKLGSYGLLRMSSLFMKTNMLLTPYMTSIALWGGVITSFICIRQTDLKSLIAYSSVGHMGLLTAGTMSNTTWGWQGSLILMIAHGLCSSALFALANMTYESTHTRSIYITKGLLSLFPALTMWWFLMAAGNMAAPPTINLLSEIVLLTSSLFLSTFTILGLGFMSFLAAAYSLYLYTSSQHGASPSFMNPMNLTLSRNYTIILLHMVPLFLTILKADVLMSWI